MVCFGQVVALLKKQQFKLKQRSSRLPVVDFSVPVMLSDSIGNSVYIKFGLCSSSVSHVISSKCKKKNSHPDGIRILECSTTSV